MFLYYILYIIVSAPVYVYIPMYVNVQRMCNECTESLHMNGCGTMWCVYAARTRTAGIHFKFGMALSGSEHK